MIKRADLAVIGDGAAILQALIERMAQHRAGEQSDAA
jgi:electron transfer flavoprotein alpha subunit